MKILVGYTGFVGSNIYKYGEFDKVYNSKNITEAFGTNPDLLVYSGLRAEKYLANNAPEKDMELILEAEENIKKINPKKLVLISTVDVLKNPNGADEDVEVDTVELHPYGYNRYVLECWAKENYPETTIIRLPGLFGVNIKKNFIYDYINLIPSMLTESKFEELMEIDSSLKDYYVSANNGFYKVIELNNIEKETLKNIYRKVGFSALNFTDSRNVYQFYPLKRLWSDIQVLLENDIRLWHPATEPISAKDLYFALEGKEFFNELKNTPVYYDFKTKYDNVFGGENGYILNKDNLISEIKNFVDKIAEVND